MSLKLTEVLQVLHIDKNNLDEELIGQSQTYYLAASDYAQAVSLRDATKEKLAQADADLDAAYRLGEKKTETQIKNLITLDPEHIRVFNEYNEAKLEAAKIQALMEALSQRNDALKELCKLYISGYWIKPSVQEVDNATYNKTREALARKRAS